VQVMLLQSGSRLARAGQQGETGNSAVAASTCWFEFMSAIWLAVLLLRLKRSLSITSYRGDQPWPVMGRLAKRAHTMSGTECYTELLGIWTGSCLQDSSCSSSSSS
jgi:hypothetical protein